MLHLLCIFHFCLGCKPYGGSDWANEWVSEWDRRVGKRERRECDAIASIYCPYSDRGPSNSIPIFLFVLCASDSRSISHINLVRWCGHACGSHTIRLNAIRPTNTNAMKKIWTHVYYTARRITWHLANSTPNKHSSVLSALVHIFDCSSTEIFGLHEEKLWQIFVWSFH